VKDRGGFLRFTGKTMRVSRSPGRSAAFTLLELLAALALAAGLTAIALPALAGGQRRAAEERARAELALLAVGLGRYRAEHGDFPRTGGLPHAGIERGTVLPADSVEAVFCAALRSGGGEGLPVGVEQGVAGSNGVVPACFVDPWGRRYLYFNRSAENPGLWAASGYWLFSAGPDGRYTAPDPLTGNFAAADAANRDNLYAGAAP
jgi:type II secretory pathway pseudopilin PulG